MENASMFPLAERKRQKFTLVLFLSFHPAVPPCMPSACHHAVQWHRTNDVIISSHLSAGPLDPWACARDTLVMMCGVQLWTWQNSPMPRCLRMPKCCKTPFEKSWWLAFELLENTTIILAFYLGWQDRDKSEPLKDWPTSSLREMASYLHPKWEIKT